MLQVAASEAYRIYLEYFQYGDDLQGGKKNPLYIMELAIGVVGTVLQTCALFTVLSCTCFPLSVYTEAYLHQKQVQHE